MTFAHSAATGAAAGAAGAAGAAPVGSRASVSATSSGAAPIASITESKLEVATTVPATETTTSPACTAPLASAEPPSTSDSTYTPPAPPGRSSRTRPSGFDSESRTASGFACMTAGAPARASDCGSGVRSVGDCGSTYASAVHATSSIRSWTAKWKIADDSGKANLGRRSL